MQVLPRTAPPIQPKRQSAILLPILLTFLLTVVVLMLLLAYVPGFSNIYTWMNPNPGKTFIGLQLSSKKSTVASLAHAMNRFLNAAIGAICPKKDEFMSLIDKIPQPGPESSCSRGTAELEGRFATSPLADDPKASSAFSNLVQVFMGAICTNNAASRDKLVALLKDLVDAICD